MTNEEAIKRIVEHMAIHKMNEPRAINISTALQMAIYSLEKQIPKKSKCYEDKFIHCPSCGIGFGYKWECYPTKVNDYSYIQYCYGCGQRIDWGESK